MASTFLRTGHVVNILTTAALPSQIRDSLTRTVPNLTKLESERKFILSDWYTWLTGKKSNEAISVDSLSLVKMSIDESRFQKEFSPTYDLALVDSFSTLLKYNDERTFMPWFDKVVAGLKEMKGIRLYGFLRGMHSEALYADVEAVADGVIELDYRERNGRLENAIRLKSLKGMPHPTEWRSLSVRENGTLELAKNN